MHFYIGVLQLVVRRQGLLRCELKVLPWIVVNYFWGHGRPPKRRDHHDHKEDRDDPDDDDDANEDVQVALKPIGWRSRRSARGCDRHDGASRACAHSVYRKDLDVVLCRGSDIEADGVKGENGAGERLVDDKGKIGCELDEDGIGRERFVPIVRGWLPLN